MKKLMTIAAATVFIGITACTNQPASGSEAQKIDTTKTETPTSMKSLIAIVEIPTVDFARAKTFYSALLDIQIEDVDLEGMKIGLFPSSDKGGSVQLIKGEGYKPSQDGVVIYFDGGDDLQKVIDKVATNGGTVIVPKTQIAPEIGYFAMFTDTEGNKLGLFSMN